VPVTEPFLERKSTMQKKALKPSAVVKQTLRSGFYYGGKSFQYLLHNGSVQTVRSCIEKIKRQGKIFLYSIEIQTGRI